MQCYFNIVTSFMFACTNGLTAFLGTEGMFSVLGFLALQRVDADTDNFLKLLLNLLF